ncbi:hypothetical protein E4U57_001125 [Claviceps arundinis]|uniref:Uncharacterized protein n=1 Tax=Claviceps arundinis TaxID=1623583 RepID=A0ABQ7PB91_9HYPO|nr:hypothetical protein E4U57_001125 [Claviceps arundinis]
MPQASSEVLRKLAKELKMIGMVRSRDGSQSTVSEWLCQAELGGPTTRSGSCDTHFDVRLASMTGPVGLLSTRVRGISEM